MSKISFFQERMLKAFFSVVQRSKYNYLSNELIKIETRQVQKCILYKRKIIYLKNRIPRLTIHQIDKYFNYSNNINNYKLREKVK